MSSSVYVCDQCPRAVDYPLYHAESGKYICNRCAGRCDTCEQKDLLTEDADGDWLCRHCLTECKRCNDELDADGDCPSCDPLKEEN
jgi:hypothetical protein